MLHFFKVGNLDICSDNLFLIAGPCVLEEREVELEIAEKVKEITANLNIPFIFKASYSKANRTSKTSYRGVGIKRGLEKLAKIKSEFDVPVLSDIHEASEAEIVSEVLDVIQIPAFLCRQTALLESAAKTDKVINIKKGQFMAPWDMKYAVEKIIESGNDKVMVTERGTSFGYNNLVVDMTTFPVMEGFGCPTVFDGTHSVQLPGGGKGETGGQRHMISTLVRAAVAAGCNGLFLEVHPDPASSPSDSASILPLEKLEKILTVAKSIKNAISEVAPRRILFGDLAVYKHFLSKDEVAKALAIQEDMDQKGEEHKLLGIIMLEQGMLTSEQLLEVLKELENGQGIKYY